jgi:hypothetical protein|tara:strand:- start:4138 stop:4245 length:108 start_codon:yes stop_codon:yes gene_type:complete
MKLENIKSKIRVWSLLYRQEIIWFAVGFIFGIILI